MQRGNTLKSVVDLWLGSHIRTTAESYSLPMRYMLRYLGPARPVNAITFAMLSDYVAHDLDRRDYAPATREKHIKTIKAFYNWCASTGFIETSPARGIRNRKPPRALDRDKAMTEEEFNAVLDAVRAKPRDTALILFLADSGVRRGGACGMKVADIDLEKRTAIVTGKGGQPRVAAFGEVCALAIAKCLAIRDNSKGYYVWHRRGAEMQPENISRIVRRACLAAGVRSRGAHSLRHRKGHQFADAKVNPSIAATALGQSVNTYLEHYAPRDFERAQQAIDDLAVKSKEPPDNVIEFPGFDAG